MTHYYTKTAVVLFHLGEPNTSKTITPFLFNFFHDKARLKLPQPFRFILAKILSSRKEKPMQNIYQSIAGKSPLLSHTLEQSHSLERELSHFGNFKTFIVMRYIQPFAHEVVEKVLAYNPDEIILLPLYPQFSTLTSEVSLHDFAKRITKKAPKTVPLKFICCYPDNADFIKSHALLIKQTIRQLYHDNLHDFEFLFSAHGVPQKIINGDPYLFHIRKTTEKIVEHLAELLKTDTQSIDHQICFQCTLEAKHCRAPSLDVALRKAIINRKIPVIIPITFVSENINTLAKLDIEHQKIVAKLGAQHYVRVPALNADGHFITALTKICTYASKETASKCFSGQKKDRLCPATFNKCPNFNNRT